MRSKKTKTEDAAPPASDPLITFADTSKAKRLLGYEPKTKVEEGMRRFIDWAKQTQAIQF